MNVVHRCAAALLGLSTCAHLIKRVKFGGFRVDSSLTLGEACGVAALTALLFAAGAFAPAWLGVPCVLALGVLVLALWFDAVLFRVFTIELGPGGVRDIVLSVLYRELSELSHARHFFRANGAFVLVPVAALLAAVDLALRVEGRAHRVLLEVAFALCARVAIARQGGPGRWRAPTLAALFGAAVLGEHLRGPAGLALTLVALAALAATVATASLAPRAPAGFKHFFVPRRPHQDLGFAPRPEHAGLVEATPRVPSKSALHGLLAGADVVLLTYESAGRDHLASYREGGARTPLFDEIYRAGVGSARHFCVCPLTNNAHVALYHGDYGPTNEGAVAALARAGYCTAYLTAARTREYGLRALVERAGFEHVFDHADLGHAPSDYDLLGAGIDRLANLPRAGRPLFLHVHATHTHLPYRVVDGKRFGRFDATDDAGRFRNGIEETDAIFAELLAALRARGVTRDPLVLVSSDHGQAFGALGYQSHGSAVVADEILVPFALAHPKLAPARLRASSHFDVLPTVLDLVGVAATEGCYGDTLFAERAPAACDPGLLLFAGHPSRTTTTHYGLVVEGRKLMTDLVLDRTYAMDWDDREAVQLDGAERAYATALLGRLMRLRGVE